eukprot:m.340969 g.340969  ORF g.340969 m.340969 type:complete len:127 (+) comp19667_c0_seq1:219-599(+)
MARKAVLDTFKKLQKEWPIVDARKGRDLGEFIKGSYGNKIESLIKSSDKAQQTFVEAEVAALKHINEDKFRNEYKREHDHIYTGDEGKRHFAKLNSAAQTEYNQPSFMDRLFGKKLPSQWSKDRKD